MTILSSLLLAQTGEQSVPTDLAQNPQSGNLKELVTLFGSDIWTLSKAILILVIGWVVAVIAKKISRSVLKRTEIDNQIAAWVTGQQDEEPIPIENWLAEGVFWIIILFVIVAFLNALNLENVSQPLNSLLNQLTSFFPQILGAGVMLALAWLVATLVKMIVIRSLQGLNLDERLNQESGEAGTETQLSLSETIGSALYWLIFLLFLPSILETLNLQNSVAPVVNLVDEIASSLPDIGKALLIGVVGWFIAQIVRRIVTNLLAVTGTDQFGEKFGLSRDRGSQSLSWIVGTIAYVVILTVVAIQALNTLNIRAISEPAIAMLDQVLNLLPKLFAAAFVLILAYMVGKLIADFVTTLLTGIGFNNILQLLGFSSITTSAAQPESEAAGTTEPTTTIQTDSETPSSPAITTRTPSELVGLIVWIAIMWVAALAAVDILGIEALKDVVGIVGAIAGQVLIGLVIFAIGLYAANFAFNLIASSGTRQSNTLAQAARIAIIILVSAMALQEMGIAPNIVNLAFGLLFGAIAVAVAIAFGVGSKDIAAEQVRAWLESFKS